MALNPLNSSNLEQLALKGLMCRTHQHYRRQWLPNTEWSNSGRWVSPRDRWSWRERLWEKEVFKTRMENVLRNVNNRSGIRAWRRRRAGWWWFITNLYAHLRNRFGFCSSAARQFTIVYSVYMSGWSDKTEYRYCRWYTVLFRLRISLVTGCLRYISRVNYRISLKTNERPSTAQQTNQKFRFSYSAPPHHQRATRLSTNRFMNERMNEPMNLFFSHDKAL